MLELKEELEEVRRLKEIEVGKGKERRRGEESETKRKK